VFSSALLTSVATAIVLTAVFRIGVRRKVAITWEPAEGAALLKGWIDGNARLWGARMELVAKAEAIVEETAHAMGTLAEGPVQVAAQYDEVALRLDVSWAGRPLPAGPADRIDATADEAAAALPLATAMIRHLADHVSESALPGGRQRLVLTLDDL
jgi:hypothetical protein